MTIIQVSPSLNIAEELSYGYGGDPEALRPGCRVIVPLGPRLTHGWVTRCDSDYKGRVKNVAAIFHDPFLPQPSFLRFVRETARLYFTSQGMLLDSSLSPEGKSLKSLLFQNPETGNSLEKWSNYNSSQLTKLAGKSVLYAFLKTSLTSALSGAASFPPIPAIHDDGAALDPEPQEIPLRRALIGYHREEYYPELISAVLKRGLSVLLITPENLSASFYLRALESLSVEVYHSGIKPKERDRMWREYVTEGKTGLLIGGLSALMLPVPRLGLIIVDRVGSPAYRSTRFSPYNLHTLARLRAEYQRIPLIEACSAPILDMIRDRGKITVDDRRGLNTPSPVEVRRIDPKVRGIPPAFLDLMQQYRDQDKKILVLLNQKESRRFLLCGKCEAVTRCSSCSGRLEVSEEFAVSCSSCGWRNRELIRCPACGQDLLMVESLSAASVKKALQKRIPESGIMMAASDTLSEEHLYHLKQRIEDSAVVIATHALINPCFYGQFDAVIHLRPELYFDFASTDGAVQFFACAGELRELKRDGGQVDIFSTLSFHYALKLINDENLFFERELNYREWFHRNHYYIEVREKSLRELGKSMREIYREHRETLSITRQYLCGRKALRGFFKGILEAHTEPENIIAAGLQRKRRVTLRLDLI